MAVLYITEQGASVHRRRGRLVVEKGGRKLDWIHLFKLEQVVIFGNVTLSPQTISALLGEGIDTIFLSTGGTFRGRLSSGRGRNVELRRRQFQRADDEGFLREMATRFVEGKLENCRSLLRSHQRRRRSPEVEEALLQIRRALRALPRCRTLDEVRGQEGAGAAAYFGCFRHLILQEGFPFPKRTRRPPRDAANALLSFGYTLLLGTITSAVETVGLDPYLGGLHAMANGKPSMVLDLMEEFRPVLVDAVALRAINRRQVNPGDFTYQEEVALPEGVGDEDEPVAIEDYPVLLNAVGRRKWIAMYEAELQRKVTYPRLGLNLDLRSICREQARLVARAIMGEEPYRPFVVR